MMRGTPAFPGGGTSVTAAMSLEGGRDESIPVPRSGGRGRGPVPRSGGRSRPGHRRDRLARAQAALESIMPVTTVRQEVIRPGALSPNRRRRAEGPARRIGLGSGPRGSQTQVRIRGAEANHSLLFVDGIRFNDPAAGNEARFELVTSDGSARIDIIRGPQSALWGSEGVGGVIAVHTVEAKDRPSLEALAEYGSQDSSRLSATASATSGRLAVSAIATRLDSEGFDSFDGTGDRDGFSNRTARLKLGYRPVTALELGAVGYWAARRENMTASTRSPSAVPTPRKDAQPDRRRPAGLRSRAATGPPGPTPACSPAPTATCWPPRRSTGRPADACRSGGRCRGRSAGIG